MCIRDRLDTSIEDTLPFWRRTIQAQGLWVIIEWIQNQIVQGGTLQEIFVELKPAFGLA